MTSVSMLGVAPYILAALFCTLMLWFRKKASLQGWTAALIAQAESRYQVLFKAGNIKFEWVVSRIYQEIPAALRPFFPRATVNAMIQETYDAMNAFAMQRLKQVSWNEKKEVDADAL